MLHIVQQKGVKHSSSLYTHCLHATYLEIVQAVLVHDVYPAKLGDCEVQEGTADCHRPVALPIVLDLSLRTLAIGEALGYRLAHCFRFAQCGNKSLQRKITIADKTQRPCWHPVRELSEETNSVEKQ